MFACGPNFLNSLCKPLADIKGALGQQDLSWNHDYVDWTPSEPSHLFLSTLSLD
jgi:hypothetical protein